MIDQATARLLYEAARHKPLCVLGQWFAEDGHMPLPAIWLMYGRWSADVLRIVTRSLDHGVVFGLRPGAIYIASQRMAETIERNSGGEVSVFRVPCWDVQLRISSPKLLDTFDHRVRASGLFVLWLQIADRGCPITVNVLSGTARVGCIRPLV